MVTISIYHHGHQSCCLSDATSTSDSTLQFILTASGLFTISQRQGFLAPFYTEDMELKEGGETFPELGGGRATRYVTPCRWYLCLPSQRVKRTELPWQMGQGYAGCVEGVGRSAQHPSCSSCSVVWTHFLKIMIPRAASICWVPTMLLRAGEDWGQDEKGATEDEMVGWHHWLKERKFEQTLGDSEGQGSLACCGPWSPTNSWIQISN